MHAHDAAATASTLKIAFLDLETLFPEDLDLGPLRELSPHCQFHPRTPPEALNDHLQAADIVISNKTVISAEALRQAPRLKLICIAATGTNNVDLAAAGALGIPVCNVRNYATPSVVQHTFALMLALRNRLFDYHGDVMAGAWARAGQFCFLDHRFQELAGKTLGIVGFGTLGQAVARVAEAFGMEVLVAQRPGAQPRMGRLPLRELLPQVDVLSLHCPLTPETRGLIDADALARMRPDALLVNTARGGIVDEAALAAALRAGRLGGAGVDVLAEEPPVHGSPLLAPDVPRLIVTPHIAWASREARQRMVDELAANIRAFLAGMPRNLVTG
ncbi:MAG: 2-hydroxyacid dehydrogenase [Pseudomonadota bacterium]